MFDVADLALILLSHIVGGGKWVRISCVFLWPKNIGVNYEKQLGKYNSLPFLIFVHDLQFSIYISSAHILEATCG